ncbi:hypothetical protein HHX47_DHR6000741 [Lentinula edodes]|nr:hypothetical protein HHX47_DHR6000741 [Lentinula edodes]
MDTASDRIAEDFTWASLAFLYYDYGLTFDEEVEHIWGMNFSSSTLLYILCRYAMLANLLYLLAHLNKLGLREAPNTMTITKLGAISCDTWYKIIAALAVLGRAAVIVTFTLRTYVVWAQSRIVLISLVMLGLATVLTDASKYLHDLLNAFTLPLSGLLTARFLLHLRAWNKARSSATTAIDIDPGQNEPDPDWHASSISSFGIQSVSVTASLNSELASAWINTAEYGGDPMLKAEGPFLT